MDVKKMRANRDVEGLIRALKDSDVDGWQHRLLVNDWIYRICHTLAYL